MAYSRFRASGAFYNWPDTRAPIPAAGFEQWDQAVYELKTAVFYAGSTELPTVQNALDAAAGNGFGVVQLPAGLVTLTTTLTMYSNVWLRGSGHGLTVLRLANGANVRMILASGLTDFLVSDLTLDGNTANNAGSSCYGIHLASTATRARLANLQIINTDAEGIFQAGTASDVAVDSVTVDGACTTHGFGGILCQGQVEVTNCRTTTIGNSAPHISVAAKSRVAGCYLTQSSGTHAGIVASGNDCEISNNLCDWTGATGTVIPTNKAANGCRITDNRVIGGTCGIHVGGSGGSVITASRNVVSGNVIDGTVDDGILLGTDSTVDTGSDNVVTGNSVYNVQADTGNPASKGVGIESQLLRSTIVGNSVNGCGGHGIYSQAAFATINGNLVYGNALQFTGYVAGIKFVASQTTVIGNTCFNNGNAGVNVGHGILCSADIADIADCTVFGNMVGDTAVSGSKAQVWGIHTAEPGAARITHLLVRGNNVENNFNGSGDSGNVGISTLSGPNWASDNPGQGEIMSSQVSGTATWDPPSIGDGAMTSTTVTVTGALLGDTAFAAFSLVVPAGALLTAQVTASNTVTVTLYNKSGGSLDLSSGTLRATVLGYR